ncbi:MAG: carboxypeptidase-like regulatory domain-containing protein [Candidatus Absconditabacteria bacterium]
MLLNNKYFYIVFTIFIVLSTIIIYGFSNYKFAKQSINPLQLSKNDINQIYSVFPNLQGKDVTKEQCFQLVGSHGYTIDCFVPADYKNHFQGIDNESEYIKLISNARVLEQVVNLENHNKDPFLQFIDFITPDSVGIYTGFADMKTHLLQVYESKDYDLDDMLRLRYIYSIESDFDKIKEIENKMIGLTGSVEFFDKHNVKLIVSGTVKTPKGDPIPYATVKMLGTDNATLTKDDGTFEFDITTLGMRTIRLEAFKIGFSNGVIPYQILVAAKEQPIKADFVLEPYTQFAVIDTIKKTIQGTNATISGNNYIVKTISSDYLIPQNALVDEYGKPFKGIVNAYFFEFTKSSNNQNLLENDIFDDVAGYAGNLMKTFGMPYVMFVTDSGQRIHVLDNNAIKLVYQIAEMNALRTNQDRIYEPLTLQDMEFLLEKSNEISGYPIDRQFLIDNKLVRFPAFWIFDQTKGIWVNQGLKVLDVDGLIEILFYTKS